MSLISSGILHAILAKKIGIVLRMEELDAWTPYQDLWTKAQPQAGIQALNSRRFVKVCGR
jgi:hypothetical protein